MQQRRYTPVFIQEAFMKPNAPLSGTVTHPSDLKPAINALSEIGQAWLKKRCKGRQITPNDIAKAADFERGELNG